MSMSLFILMIAGLAAVPFAVAIGGVVGSESARP